MHQLSFNSIQPLVRTLFLGLVLLGTHAVQAQQNPLGMSSTEQSQLQVNVNEADAETIADVLVGIGASRARAIIEYREQNGPFTSLEDLVRVNGVGEATVQNNRERILFD